MHSMVKDPFLNKPAVYLADNTPGGVGLAEAAFGLRKTLIEAAAESVMSCQCEKGCPACVGALGASINAKETARRLLSTFEVT